MDDIPGWEDRLLAAVRMGQAQRRARVHRPGASSHLLLASVEMSAAIHRAAKARDISVAGWLRRTVARQLADDLGVDPLELLATTTKPTPYGGRTGTVPEKDDGLGFGDWGFFTKE